MTPEEKRVTMADLHLTRARLFLALMDHENQIAAKETSADGWLSDHTQTVHEYAREVEAEIQNARNCL